MRPPPSAQTASICGSRLGSFEPESFAMLLVCQSIWPSSLRGWENQAIFAARSPTAIRDIRLFRLRRKQIPETSRSGTWTTRRTRSWAFLTCRFLPLERSLAAIGFHRILQKQTPICAGQDRVGLKSNVRFGAKADTCSNGMSTLPPKADIPLRALTTDFSRIGRPLFRHPDWFAAIGASLLFHRSD